MMAALIRLCRGRLIMQLTGLLYQRASQRVSERSLPSSTKTLELRSLRRAPRAAVLALGDELLSAGRCTGQSAAPRRALRERRDTDRDS
jgi:hypothetical protein